MNTLKLLSPAKINLTLEIINKRSDDFHNIISLVTDISLTDELFFTASDQINFESNVELEENSNSILKTIFLIKNKFQLDNGIAVKLVKNIPLSSGLGGGSSNAATTLLALNKLWELNLNTSDLIYLGSKIGSDVPYFIQKGLSVISDKGETIRRLDTNNQIWFVLLFNNHNHSNKTKLMYSSLANHNFTNGGLTRKLEARIRNNSDIPNELLFNCFDNISDQIFDGLSEKRKVFQSLVGEEVILCGAGPTLFYKAPNKETATAIQLLLTMKHGLHSEVVHSGKLK